MRITISHPILKVKCTISGEKVLASSGMSPEDVKRCFSVVPADLKEDVERSADAINAFIKAWCAAPTDAKPILPVWVISIESL